MATARLNGEYAKRMYGICALLLAMAAWSVYDGAVAWPRANRDLDEMRPELLKICSGKPVPPEVWLSPSDSDPGRTMLDEVFGRAGKKAPGILVQNLSEITRPEGASSQAIRERADAAAELFGKGVYSAGKIQGQFFMAALLAVLAMAAFRAAWSKRGVEYVVDDSGLSGSGFGGGAIPWEEVASVDWSRWEGKGIVALATGDGRRFVLDGWHFKGIRDIAAEIERRFPRQ